MYKQRVNKSIVGIYGFISYLKYYQTIEKNIFKKEYDSEIWFSMEQL